MNDDVQAIDEVVVTAIGIKQQKKPVTVVTYPEALAEKVVSRKRLSDAMLTATKSSRGVS